MAFIRSIIRGVGASLPKRMMTNDDLARMVDTSDEWIRDRTGIEQRHIAAEGELTSDLGIAASHQALVRAGIDPIDIDLVVCATSTPDRTFPATGVRIQAGLGVTKGAAFDVQAVCSGFIYALSIADNFLKAGQFKRAIVVGAETFSRILDWKDRSTCVLFGDGAGAVVLEAQTQLGAREDRGILATRIRSDGRFEELLYVDGGPGSTKTTGHLRMNGREVFRHAVQKISGVIEETLVMTGYASDEVDLYVPHQANKRILDGIAKRLSIPPEKIVFTLAKHGNTSAASIPLALNQAFEDHRLVEGRLVLMEAMGGGLTWGAALARW
ncbi:MAG TPA: beta-ketoacyl-ACP synthase III [Hyphomicrobiaceae bacterium]|nr:beta-ketoacyl-ACP synthase III [Hyphomicrobiaceae bacterium]